MFLSTKKLEVQVMIENCTERESWRVFACLRTLVDSFIVTTMIKFTLSCQTSTMGFLLLLP